MTVNTIIGKITASKDTLNELSIALSEASESYAKREMPASSERAFEVSSKIYTALCGKDYYKN